MFAALQLRGIRLGALIQESATSLIGLAIVVLSLVLFFVEASPAGVTDLVPRAAMREAVLGAVPAGTEELNLKAFASGLEFADGAVTQPALRLTRPPGEGVIA